MTTVVYGRLTIPLITPAPRGPETAPVAIEPTSSRTYRRRYEHSCVALTVDGHQIGPFKWDQKKQMRAALGLVPGFTNSRARVRCDYRPGVEIDPSFVMDLCLTSACAECPFKPEERKPVIRHVVENSKIEPRRLTIEEDLALRRALAARIRAEVAARGLLMRDVSRAIGWSDDHAAAAVGRLMPKPLEMIAAWLGVEQ